MLVHTRRHRGQDLYLLFTLSPALILWLLSSEGKSKQSRLRRNLFYVPAKMLKWLWAAEKRKAADRRVINARSQTHKQQCSYTNIHTDTRTTAFQQSFGSVLAHFSPLVQTQQQPKLPFVKVKLKAKQLHGPERCLWTDESQCHTSIRAAHIHRSPSLNILASWYPDVGNMRDTRQKERKEGKDSQCQAIS